MNVKRFEKAESIAQYKFVRLKETGNIFEIMYSQRRSQGGYIKKLDKDNYIDLRTGELNRFNHLSNRADDISNIAKSLAQGRDILNTNITDVSKCRWLTLTYAENMTDSDRLVKDFRDFNKRCRSIFGHYEYITCAEPQGRGAWHLHCVLIFQDKAPYMSNDIVAECWKQGFVKIKKLDDVDNVGAYLTAYLGDIELAEGESAVHGAVIKSVDIVDEQGNKQVKKYIKGARLYMYPPGFHIFRCSKGIKQPVISRVQYRDIKEKISSAKLTFSKTIELVNVENEFNNVLTYEYYNTLRK